MKIVHTADVHLGARFGMLGETKGSAQRLQLQRTFEGVGELAVDEKADALIIAGDLFDSNSPSASSIAAVQRVLNRVSGEGARVFLIPGTHDCYDATSVYRTVDFGSAGAVTVFGDEAEPVNVPELGLTVHGLVFATKKAPPRAMDKIRRGNGDGIHIGIAHGSLAIPGILEDDSLVFTAEEASETGMDYLALGHWHSFRQEKFGRVVACYPGSPEFVSADQKGAGQVAIVEIGGSGAVRVEPRTVGVRRYHSIELPVDALSSSAQITDAIRSEADGDLALDVRLSGLASLDLDINIDDLVEEMQDQFFHLRMRDESHPALGKVAMAELAETTVAGKFARIMETRIDEASGPEKSDLENALRLGVALLEGRQVLQ